MGSAGRSDSGCPMDTRLIPAKSKQMLPIRPSKAESGHLRVIMDSVVLSPGVIDYVYESWYDSDGEPLALRCSLSWTGATETDVQPGGDMSPCPASPLKGIQ